MHILLQVYITDTGIGIPREKLESIFEKFVQADTSTTRKYGGTGLGLAITKQLIELMGGTISVESEQDVGSTFSFAIPFEITDTLTNIKRRRRQKRAEGTLPVEQVRVLVAEDHPLNQALIRKLLERYGIRHCHITRDGVEAVKYHQEMQPDIVLMDCHMPGKNGYDATKDIRDAETGTGKRVPIIAMTANAMVGDREKCLRFGMDEYISKPIDSEELKEILAQWIRFESMTEVSDSVSAKKGSFDLSVLKSFTDGDAAVEKELVQMFVKQSDDNIQVLSRLESTANSASWTEAAHMFKGGAAGIGAETLRALCDKAQHFEGTSDEQAALFEKIKAEYAHVKDELRAAQLLD